MSERTKHLFQFGAHKISAAAGAEAVYHESRIEFWRGEHEKAVAIVKQTAKVEIKEYEVTGGTRADLCINYGDSSAYARMKESWDKMAKHRQAAEQYRMDEQTYGSQGDHFYHLDAADVLYYRLGGGPREE